MACTTWALVDAADIALPHSSLIALPSMQGMQGTHAGVAELIKVIRLGMPVGMAGSALLQLSMHLKRDGRQQADANLKQYQQHIAACLVFT